MLSNIGNRSLGFFIAQTKEMTFRAYLVQMSVFKVKGLLNMCVGGCGCVQVWVCACVGMCMCGCVGVCSTHWLDLLMLLLYCKHPEVKNFVFSTHCIEINTYWVLTNGFCC